MPNGIDLILRDHRDVNTLFARFTETGDGSLIGEVLDRLAAHDDAEHGALYPLLGTVLGDEDMVMRAAAAHSAVKKQIDVVKGLEGPPLIDAFDVLRTLVTEHVADEENVMLPALAAGATPAQLDGLGARILQIKQRVG